MSDERDGVTSAAAASGGAGSGGSTGESAQQGWANRAEREGYPPDHGPEERVLLHHPAMFRARPMVFLGLTLACILCAVGVGFGAFGGFSPLWGGVLMAISATLLVVLLFSLGLWKVQQVSRSIEITNKRTIQSVGLFSKKTTEVLHDNIRAVRIEQVFWERVWNIGTIRLSSSADEIEVQMNQLKDPDKLRKIIDLYRPL